LFSLVPHESLPEFLNQVKLFIVPSYQEGIPLTLKEVMACGAIVVATRVGGIPGILEDGKTGVIMRDNSPACLAQAIARALVSPRLEQDSCARKVSYRA
jgi:glycosyltransferase involved in cell wall biosynthesis